MLPLLFALLAVFAPKQAKAEWHEASTEHFIIYSDAPEEWLRSFAERLEKFDSGLRYLYAIEDDPGRRSNRLVIHVLATERAASRLCGKDCRNAAGFYIPRVGRSVAFTPQDFSRWAGEDFKPEVMLFHEYAHHLMYENSNVAYPRWFSEGFAEFNSTAQPSADGSWRFGRDARHRAYGLTSGNKLGLPVILDPGARKIEGAEADFFYGRSWLLLHYLQFEPARRGQLASYIKEFNQGKPSAEAARTAFGDLLQLSRELDQYLRRDKLDCYVVAAERIKVGSIAIRPLTAGETASLDLQMRLDRGLDKEQAVSMTAEARNMAKPFSDDASAQTVLGEIEYEAGYLDEADAALDRALAADSRFTRALLAKGLVAVQRLVEAKSSDTAAWSRARSWFVKANKIDPDAAEPLFRFALTFSQMDAPINENAATALARAFRLSPQDGHLRQTYAWYLLTNDRTQEARLVLIPLAYAPHGSGSNPALTLVQAIDAGATGRKVLDAVSDRKPAKD